MVEKLAPQGEPLESVTVAAGDIVTSAQRARLKFIAFKPGNVSAINVVAEVCTGLDMLSEQRSRL